MTKDDFIELLSKSKRWKLKTPSVYEGDNISLYLITDKIFHCFVYSPCGQIAQTFEYQDFYYQEHSIYDKYILSKSQVSFRVD